MKPNFLRGYAKPEGIQKFLSESNYPAVCFVGRSNVGKSSLINTLFGKKTARTSKTPGRTQEINTYELINNDQKYILFDLPGYGFANVPLRIKEEWNLLLGAFFESLDTNVLLINIQDARHPLQKSDLAFIDMIKNIPQQKILCLNKIDKLKKQKDRSMLDKLLKENVNDTYWASDILKVSAESKVGIDNLKNKIYNFLQT